MKKKKNKINDTETINENINSSSQDDNKIPKYIVCENCKKKISAEDKICMYCGNTIKSFANEVTNNHSVNKDISKTGLAFGFLIVIAIIICCSFPIMRHYDDLEKQRQEDAMWIEMPNIKGKNIDEVTGNLSREGISVFCEYKTTSSYEKDTIISYTIASDTRNENGKQKIRKETGCINVVVAESYDNYRGDDNTDPIFQINVLAKNVRIRSTPTTTEDNQVGNVRINEVYNVYETVNLDDGEWYRIGYSEWIKSEKGWYEKDTYCTGGYYTDSKIYILESMGIYDKPIENEETRNKVDMVFDGNTYDIYYKFENSQHVWYKIGPNRWVKDKVYGLRAYETY